MGSIPLLSLSLYLSVKRSVVAVVASPVSSVVALFE